MNRLEARNEPQDDESTIPPLPDMPFTLPRRGSKFCISDASGVLRRVPTDRALTGLAHRQAVRLPLLLQLALFAGNDDPPTAQQAALLPNLPFVYAKHVTRARAICGGVATYVYAGRNTCYDWVAVRGQDAGETWYARLLLFFTTDDRRGALLPHEQRHGHQEWMLLRYLEEVDVERDHVLHARHFAFARMRLHVVELASLQARATLATSPRKLQDGRTVQLMLPYGKCVNR